MKIIKEGTPLLPPWQKIITCKNTREKGRAMCGAIFEVETQDLKKEDFGNQDERTYEYTYHVLCPTCTTKIHVPECNAIVHWR